MKSVLSVNRKSMKIVPSGRSSDFISPSFGHGCLADCAYCYMKRHLPEKQVSIANNTMDILTAINNHATFAVVDKPNQTDSKYITYDISCNEDFVLHSKYHNWIEIFTFFRNHPIAKATLATKFVDYNLLEFDSQQKVRIRFSLMPINYSKILEPNTSSIQERLDAIVPFLEAGYDVHLNFSPVIVTPVSLSKYKELFELVNQAVPTMYRKHVKCEVIFLTHSENMHQRNLAKGKNQQEELLWCPQKQEIKTSGNGENNIRYERKFKANAMAEFVDLLDKVCPWCEVRYIF